MKMGDLRVPPNLGPPIGWSKFQLLQEVLVLELLAASDCLDAVSQQRFFRRRVQPVLKRLGA